MCFGCILDFEIALCGEMLLREVDGVDLMGF
jgi:hypothetical protein